MVGFTRDSPTKEELNQQPLKLKKPDDSLALDLSLSDVEDVPPSFADSFLDFDCLRDWIQESPLLEMDISEPVLEKGDSTKMEIGAPGAQKDHSPTEPTSVDMVQNTLGSLIVEDIANVSLEGVLGELALGGGVDTTSQQPAIDGDNIARYVETTGLNENSEIVPSDGDITKSDKKEADEESDSSSSDSESSSSSSSSASSSSSDDDDDDKEKEELDMEEGEIRDSDVDNMVAWSDEDEDVVKGPIRSKNEVQDLPPVPPVNASLQPHHQTLPVGVVLSILGTQVIVEGIEKHDPLNEGSILWITESRTPLGLIDEIFGPVKNPYYMIRYNSEDEVPSGVEQGISISFVPEFANHVLNDSSLYRKGYDASGENDEELSEELEFSDDEKEAEYRRMQKMAKRGANDSKPGNKKDKQSKNRGGTWRNNQGSAPQTPEGSHQPPTNRNQPCGPPPPASQNHGNPSRPFGPPPAASQNHGNPSQPFGPGGLVQPFPQMVQASGFVPPQNAIPFQQQQQQQQNMVFGNGHPPGGIPWMQQNPFPQPFPMPMSNGMMPFQQQQFVPNPGFPTNFALPGGPQNFCAGPGFAPWPGAPFAQNGFNQPFGMGMQGQQGSAPSMNVGEQGSSMGQQPPVPDAGNNDAPQQFNQGSYRGGSGGRKPFHRGGSGGRFGRGGGRGRQQSR